MCYQTMFGGDTQMILADLSGRFMNFSWPFILFVVGLVIYAIYKAMTKKDDDQGGNES